MSNAKEKADELIDKMYYVGRYDDKEDYNPAMAWERAKQCALVAVNEILESEPRNPSDVDWDDVGGTHQYYYESQRDEAEKYWKEVKQEIEKL
jgi:hypothetical protein